MLSGSGFRLGWEVPTMVATLHHLELRSSYKAGVAFLLWVKVLSTGKHTLVCILGQKSLSMLPNRRRTVLLSNELPGVFGVVATTQL